jgi:hypothetical protein
MKLRSLLTLGLLIGAIYPRSAIGLETIVYTDKEFGFRVEYPSDWTSKGLSEITISEGVNPRLSIVLANGKDVAMCLFAITPFPASKQFPTSFASCKSAPWITESNCMKLRPAAANATVSSF